MHIIYIYTYNYYNFKCHQSSSIIINHHKSNRNQEQLGPRRYRHSEAPNVQLAAVPMKGLTRKKKRQGTESGTKKHNAKRRGSGTVARRSTCLSPLHRSMAGRRDPQQALLPGQPLP
jgi:hypothetical protein